MRMRMMAMALALAACGGGDGAAVEATFAPGLGADGVWVVESERRERADSSGFALADLTPGPVSIRLLRGADTAALLNVAGLPDGARVRLQELRVDGDSRYAFPRAVELDGAEMVTVNGLRMAPEGRIPRAVDVRGAVMAWSSDVGALLFRPDDARMPDLRVVVGRSTEVVGEDGGGADPVAMRPGDSVRVEGSRDAGYVRASRLTLPTRIGQAPVVEDDGGEDEGGNGGEDADDDAGRATAAAAVRRPAAAHASRPAPRVAAPAARSDDRPGRGNGNGRGRGQAKKPKDRG
jgi:hypothetical protein